MTFYKEAQIQKTLLKNRDEYAVYAVTDAHVRKTTHDNADAAEAQAARHAGENVNYLPDVVVDTRKG